MNTRLLMAALCGLWAAPGLGQVLTIYEYESATLTDLGTLPGDTWSKAYDINDWGHVVGASSTPQYTHRAFVYQTGGMFALDTTGVAASSTALGINNLGQKVGWYYAPGAPVARPWYSPAPLNGIVPLAHVPYLSLDYDWITYARAINDSGRIVGDSERRNYTGTDPIPNTGGDCYTRIPVYWSSSVSVVAMLFCPADTAGASVTIAHDINNSGRVVGSDNQTTPQKMFSHYVPDNPDITAVPAPASSSAGNVTFKYGEAFGVSNDGRVAGVYRYTGANSTPLRRALYWNGTSPNSSDLGVLPGGTWSEAKEVNDTGFVVGTSDFTFTLGQSSWQRTGAFIWHSHFGMKRLPSPMQSAGQIYQLVPKDCEATAVNNRNTSTGLVQVAGHCRFGSEFRAVRWNVIIGTKIPVLNLP